MTLPTALRMRRALQVLPLLLAGGAAATAIVLTSATPPTGTEGPSSAPPVAAAVGGAGATTSGGASAGDNGNHYGQLKQVQLDVTPAQGAFTLARFAPGDRAARAFTVTNSGKRDFTYSTTLTGDGTLGPWLQTRTGTLPAPAPGDTQDALDARCAAATLPSTAPFGGAVRVITDRLLTAGSSTVVCVQVALPSTTTSAASGKSATASVTFDATEVK